MSTILITGGTGLIGSALTEALLKDGHELRHLSRSSKGSGQVRTFTWNVGEGTMDRAAIRGVDHIVHLAGAGIADKRWTTSRIDELISSRAASSRLLLRVVAEEGVMPASFISAAGVGYYGASTSDRILTEIDAPGTDAIACISVAWEQAVDEWGDTCRVVKLRTPVVLSAAGGALPQLARPVRFGLGAALGSGMQWMPWVHMGDLVNAYRKALDDERMNGAFNVVAGNASNAEMMRTVASVLGKPFFLPNVPAFALKLALGELSSILLGGSRASSEHLLAAGFGFEHPKLESALRDLLKH